jgi:ectoine hydroxylase-related dioxygenase (phytanoyl-CoA dioxygenase family)
MRLSDAQARAFVDDGFVVVPSVFSAAEVDMVRGAFDRLYATAQRIRVTSTVEGGLFVLSAPADRDVVVHRVVWAAGPEPALLGLSADARLVEPALQLLGTSSCAQLLSQAHFKMPNDGVAFAWHQDVQHRDKGNGTWHDVTGRGSYVQAIVLVDDMTPDNGPLRFAPPDAAALDARGRLVTGADPYDTALPQPAGAEVGRPVVDEARAVVVTGHAGDVLFFGPYAVHGSEANTSTSPRRVWINGYAAPGANGRVYPGSGLGRPLP